MLRLSKEEIEALQYAALDDATKVIRYLEEEKEKRKTYDLIVFICSVISAIGAVIAAVVGIIALF